MSRKLVVTGASSGIGRATALRARRLEWEVFASVRKEPDSIELERHDCRTGLLELTDPRSLDEFGARVTDWCAGSLDVLVNSAGAAFPGPVEELPSNEIQEQFEINVFGQIGLTRRLLPALRAARGRIVFISSDRARAAVPTPTPEW